jgi:hypothetical protein
MISLGVEISSALLGTAVTINSRSVARSLRSPGLESYAVVQRVCEDSAAASPPSSVIVTVSMRSP